MTKNKHASLELKTNQPTNKNKRALSPPPSLRCAPTLPPNLPHARFCLSVFFFSSAIISFVPPLYLRTFHLSLASSNPHGHRPSQIRLIVAEKQSVREGVDARARTVIRCFPRAQPASGERRQTFFATSGCLAGWPAERYKIRGGPGGCCSCRCYADSSDLTPRLGGSPHSGRMLRSARRAGITAAGDVHLLPPTWACEVRRPSRRVGFATCYRGSQCN